MGHQVKLNLPSGRNAIKRWKCVLSVNCPDFSKYNTCSSLEFFLQWYKCFILSSTQTLKRWTKYERWWCHFFNEPQCVSGFNRYFWSWSQNSRSVDQSGDTQPRTVTEVRTNSESSSASRSASALLSAFIPYLLKFLFVWPVCHLPGLEHYGDLNQPVTKAEADAVGEIVEKAVASALPGTQVTLIGGFRR